MATAFTANPRRRCTDVKRRGSKVGDRSLRKDNRPAHGTTEAIIPIDVAGLQRRAPGLICPDWKHPPGAGPDSPSRKVSAMEQHQEPSNPADEVVARILADMRRIAVVGLSARPDRASYGVTRFLVGRGLEVVGVNPALNEAVLGLKIYAELSEVPGPVDVVDVFRRSDMVPEIIDQAIAAGASAVWLQEGVVHEEAAARARSAGLTVIQDRCLYKEWLRLHNG
jgi:predicted CoA-binding protein